MTVREWIAKLQTLDQDAQVLIVDDALGGKVFEQPNDVHYVDGFISKFGDDWRFSQPKMAYDTDEPYRAAKGIVLW